MQIILALIKWSVRRRNGLQAPILRPDENQARKRHQDAQQWQVSSPQSIIQPLQRRQAPTTHRTTKVNQKSRTHPSSSVRTYWRRSRPRTIPWPWTQRTIQAQVPIKNHLRRIRFHSTARQQERQVLHEKNGAKLHEESTRWGLERSANGKTAFR